MIPRKLVSLGVAACLFGPALYAAEAPVAPATPAPATPAQAPAAKAKELVIEQDTGVVTAVFAKTDTGYKRKKDKYGKWVREYYAMSNGGPAEWTIHDEAQEKIKFVAIARVLAEHLAKQGFFPATEKDKVDLLIVVKWGRTMPFDNTIYREQGIKPMITSIADYKAADLAYETKKREVEEAGGKMEGIGDLSGSEMLKHKQAAQSYQVQNMAIQDLLTRQRNDDNAKNAHLLGYMGDINNKDGIHRLAGGNDQFDDLVADIEEARYYIVLTSYDFKTVNQKEPKLQWVTRMSMRAKGNNFAEKAAAMLAAASSRFGQNTNGLERGLASGYNVNLADLRFLGVVDKAKQFEEAAAAAEKAEKEN